MGTATAAGWAGLRQRWRALDARLLQIAFLLTFLLIGVQETVVSPAQALLALGAALATQAAFLAFLGVRDVGFLSAAVTGLGVAILLRSDLLWLPALGAALAIASKFTLRFRARHLFNPANFAIGALMLCTSHAWVSPSQWSEGAVGLLWVMMLGLLVTVRALRSDVSLAFLACYALLKAGRVLYLGQRPEVLLHQLAVGSLLIFTFFMISDPKTTPRTVRGRVAFAAVVATCAFVMQHVFWIQGSLIFALLLLSPLPSLWSAIKERIVRFRTTRSTPCAISSPS